MSKILAIDYGTRRIGIAISDETNTIAIPKPYIKLQEKNKILALIQNERVNEILLGLPQGLRGQDTAMTKAVRDFARWFEEKTGLQVRLIDERFTTKEVQKMTKDRELIDSLVAQKILERYLEQLG